MVVVLGGNRGNDKNDMTEMLAITLIVIKQMINVYHVNSLKMTLMVI